MKSYIKLYGPPVMKALKALEKVAIGWPEVCIMDTAIYAASPSLEEADDIYSYFSMVGDITQERCSSIISESGESLGEYDFFYEWFTGPTAEQLNELIGKIDDALTPVGCKYTITTN